MYESEIPVYTSILNLWAITNTRVQAKNIT
jgi:uncharacterized glyoxalase superfamily metalloenzyme YdcJ